MGASPTKLLIGRDRECDIALAHETVSGRHAELTFLPAGKLLLADCKSRNGTFRLLPGGSEQRIHQQLVSPMDRVRLGEVTLTVREILEAARLKYPRMPEPPAPVQEGPPPVQGRHLERCDCGAVKTIGAPCPECGR
jgi:hypothetical protein